jgi:Ni2+-binding GTPase involved in maturation of urease and hydrogenase
MRKKFDLIVIGTTGGLPSIEWNANSPSDLEQCLCHLEAAMVQNALEGWDVGKLDFLFAENVGNLICPSSYDLGEDLRLVLLSVTREKTSR